MDPDDAFSVVPYEKGYTFLRYLESILGKTNFQNLLRTYINKFAYKSVSWIDFKLTFQDFAIEIYGESQAQQTLSKIDWDNWVKTTGEPFIKQEFGN